MEHPSAIHPVEHAVFQPDKMGKATLFRSERLMVGLNAFEPVVTEELFIENASSHDPGEEINAQLDELEKTLSAALVAS